MFMIVPPVPRWDAKDREKIWIHSGASSIDRTPALAWAKHCRGDLSKVQAWFDRGYRLKEIEVTILEPALDGVKGPGHR